MNKTLWHTIQIEIPREMAELTKQGKVVIKKSLTKTSNISRSQKQPAIKLIPANILKPNIINDGKVWNVDELKTRMTKARALQSKNKDKNIFEPTQTTFNSLNKFEGNIIKRARELGTQKKKTIIKFGDITKPEDITRKKEYGWTSKKGNSQDATDVYNNVINYYWDNAYKFMNEQDIPKDDELTQIAYVLYSLTPKYKKMESTIMLTSAITASNKLWSIIRTITDGQYKIIMKVAYNDSINKNHKFLYRACNIYKNKLKDDIASEQALRDKRELEYTNRTPEQIQQDKQFRERMNKGDIII